MEQLMQQAEQLKRQADLQFAKGQYNDAIIKYLNIEEILLPAKGVLTTELILLKSYANAIACYMKLKQYNDMNIICDKAILIPISIKKEGIHLLSKIYHRKSLALEGLEKYEDSVIAIDRAISIELYQVEIQAQAQAGDSTDAGTGTGTGTVMPPTVPKTLTELRQNLCNLVISKRDTFVALPPIPIYLNTLLIQECIKLIISYKCDPKNKIMMEQLQQIIQTRGFVGKYKYKYKYEYKYEYKY
jgi:tetratricopeptide (TPR) repeat protein